MPNDSIIKYLYKLINRCRNRTVKLSRRSVARALPRCKGREVRHDWF